MSARLGQLARRLGFDRNPLRRRIDRVQTVLAFLLVAAFLTAAPVLTAAAGHWARAAGIREEQAQRAWRQVTAIVMRGPAGRQDRALAAWGNGRASARWTAPDGQVRSGLVPVSSGTRTGSRVPVWVDRTGFPAGAPLRPAQQRQRTALAELLTMWALAIAVCLIADVGRGLLDRRRIAAWGTEWRAIEPLWSRQP